MESSSAMEALTLESLLGTLRLTEKAIFYGLVLSQTRLSVQVLYQHFLYLIGEHRLTVLEIGLQIAS